MAKSTPKSMAGISKPKVATPAALVKATAVPAAETLAEDWESPEDSGTSSGSMGGRLAAARRAPWWLRLSGGLLVLALLLVGSFELVYLGKIYPGVSADGVELGGLTRAAAITKLQTHTDDFTGHPLTIATDGTTVRIPVASLGTSYDLPKVVDLAFNYGRGGTMSYRLRQQVRALAGRVTNFSAYHYDDASLAPYLSDLVDDHVTPVQNAGLSFNDNRAQVTPATAGSRVNLGRLIQLINDRMSEASIATIDTPVYKLEPDLPTGPLEAVTTDVNRYVAAPITLAFSDKTQEIDQSTIISWIQVTGKPRREFLVSHTLDDIYPPAPTANLGLSQAAVKAYVAGLGKQIDQTARNAALSMKDGALAIDQPSRTGVKLDQDKAAAGITGALQKPAGDREVALDLTTTRADVNEDNLASLGIKEQISEGQTFFPGSPSTRLTNVRAGARKFNGVLLKPNETFSFGALLGEVGPQTGYVPELVILADHEEKQYGGGLCQVSSTAFRAALAAGLPITERHNHSFAISYYTAPYGVPGIDATIYYPAVDFKFKNDTGAYILIQTVMQGTTLTFDFFGTKSKYGTIRGPEFVSGDSDATKPSHTVFYRDVMDMNNKLITTTKFDTYYKSSKDFPVDKQYN